MYCDKKSKEKLNRTSDRYCINNAHIVSSQTKLLIILSTDKICEIYNASSLAAFRFSISVILKCFKEILRNLAKKRDSEVDFDLLIRCILGALYSTEQIVSEQEKREKVPETPSLT